MSSMVRAFIFHLIFDSKNLFDRHESRFSRFHTEEVTNVNDSYDIPIHDAEHDAVDLVDLPVEGKSIYISIHI